MTRLSQELEIEVRFLFLPFGEAGAMAARRYNNELRSLVRDYAGEWVKLLLAPIWWRIAEESR